MNDDDRKLFALASKAATPVRRKSELELFIDFLRDEGTIIDAGPNQVEAEGHDVIRFFRPDAGLTISHFDALAAIDPYASEMLSRAVVERLLIDRGFDWLEVYRVARSVGYAFWNQVPDHKSIELAAQEIEVTLYQQREELRKERDRHDESKINPLEDWSVIVVRQGTFPLTPLARKVFPVIYRQHLKGLYTNQDYLRQMTGEDGDRFDRCLRTSEIWGTVVGPVPGKKGFWRIIP